MTQPPASLGVVVGGLPGDAARLARAAEDAGLDHVWLHEAGNDATVMATVVVSATARIGVGTDVQVAFARSPTLAAFTAWDLQGLSGGRFTLGLGSQVRAIVEDGFSAAFDQPAARMAEYLQVVAATHATLAGTPTTFVGSHYRLTRPAPYGVVDPDRVRPRTMLAAVGPLMTATAARHADGLLGHPFTSPAFIAQRLAPRVATALRAAGRARSDFVLATGAIVSVEADRDRARRRARRQVAFYGSTPAYHDVFAANHHDGLAEACRTALRADRPDRLHEAVPDDVLDHYALAGTPDDVVAALPAWQGLVDHLVLSPPTVGLSPAERAAATRRLVEAVARPVGRS